MTLYDQYIQEVSTGAKVVCIKQGQAIDRHLRDLKESKKKVTPTTSTTKKLTDTSSFYSSYVWSKVTEPETNSPLNPSRRLTSLTYSDGKEKRGTIANTQKHTSKYPRRMQRLPLPQPPQSPSSTYRASTVLSSTLPPLPETRLIYVLTSPAL